MQKKTVSFMFGLIVLMFIFIMLICVLFLFATYGRRLPVFGRAVVAVVKVEGAFMDTSQEISLLRKYTESSFVGAIVLRIETPGGAVGCAQEFHREILKARRDGHKPIIASMGNVAASGGYYISCAADEIYANPGTVTGSIGVLLETFDFQDVGKKIGITVNTVKSGKFKDTGSYFREMTAEEKQLLQETIDDTHNQFLEAVMEGRRVELARAYLRRLAAGTTATLAADRSTSPSDSAAVDQAQAERVPRLVVRDYLRSFADGRVLSGHQAWELGLVDHLGNFQDAVARAAALAGIRGKPRILQEKRRTSLWDLLENRTNVVSHLATRFGFALEYRLSLD